MAALKLNGRCHGWPCRLQSVDAVPVDVIMVGPWMLRLADPVSADAIMIRLWMVRSASKWTLSWRGLTKCHHGWARHAPVSRCGPIGRLHGRAMDAPISGCMPCERCHGWVVDVPVS